MDEDQSLASTCIDAQSSSSPAELLSIVGAISDPDITDLDDFMNHFLCFDHTTLELELPTLERPSVCSESHPPPDVVSGQDLAETSSSCNLEEEDTSFQSLATTSEEWNSINPQNSNSPDAGIDPIYLVDDKNSHRMLGACSTAVSEPETPIVPFESVLQDMDLPEWLLNPLTDESNSYFTSMDSSNEWMNLDWDDVNCFAGDVDLPAPLCLQDQAHSPGGDQHGSPTVHQLSSLHLEPALEVGTPSSERHSRSSLGPETSDHGEMVNATASRPLQKSGKAQQAQKPRYTQQDWERIRPYLVRYYLHEGKTLSETRAVIAKQHNFSASEQMFKKRMKAWKIEKNMTAARKDQDLRKLTGKSTASPNVPRQPPQRLNRILRYAQAQLKDGKLDIESFRRVLESYKQARSDVSERRRQQVFDHALKRSYAAILETDIKQNLFRNSRINREGDVRVVCDQAEDHMTRLFEALGVCLDLFDPRPPRPCAQEIE